MNRRQLLAGIGTIGVVAIPGCQGSISTTKPPGTHSTAHSPTLSNASASRQFTLDCQVVDVFFPAAQDLSGEPISDVTAHYPPTGDLLIEHYEYVRLNGTYYEAQITAVPGRANYTFEASEVKTVGQNSTVTDIESLSSEAQSAVKQVVADGTLTITTNGSFPHAFSFMARDGQSYVDLNDSTYNIVNTGHSDAFGHREATLEPTESPGETKADVIDTVDLPIGIADTIRTAIQSGSATRSGTPPVELRSLIEKYGYFAWITTYYKPRLSTAENEYTLRMVSLEEVDCLPP